MLILKKGINEVYMTISELNTINNAIYNIIITEETTNISKNVLILDTSIYAIRYNKFQIELVNDIANEDLSNGIVYLNQGKHTYKVIATNPLDYDNYVVCELGIIKVLKDEVTLVNSNQQYTAPQEYISYTGNISINP